MNHRTWAVVVVLLASPVLARAQSSTAGSGGADATKSDASKKKEATKKGAQDGKAQDKAPEATKAKTKRTPKSYEADKPRVPQQAHLLANRTRSVFMFAMETCGNTRSNCDASFRDDAEKQFMDACGACTTFERCDADRKAIKDGKASSRHDPCGQ